jgi:hypothetical protein
VSIHARTLFLRKTPLQKIHEESDPQGQAAAKKIWANEALLVIANPKATKATQRPIPPQKGFVSCHLGGLDDGKIGGLKICMSRNIEIWTRNHSCDIS